MKTNYLLQSKKNNRGKKISLGIFAAVFVLAVAAKTFLPSFWAGFFEKAAVPFWKAKDFFSGITYDGFSMLKSKQTLIDENQSLKEKIQNDELKLLNVDVLSLENEDLKAMLGRKSSKDAVLAGVLSKPPQSPYDTLILDAGSTEGVVKGDLVMAGEDIAIGEISEVFENSSQVKLYSSPGEEVVVTIGSGGLSATASGKGGGNFEAKIPRDIPISKGDVVLMPGINPILYGTVEDVEIRPADSFQYVLFKSPVNASFLSRVLVRKTSSQSAQPATSLKTADKKTPDKK